MFVPHFKKRNCFCHRTAKCPGYFSLMAPLCVLNSQNDISRWHVIFRIWRRTFCSSETFVCTKTGLMSCCMKRLKSGLQLTKRQLLHNPFPRPINSKTPAVSRLTMRRPLKVCEGFFDVLKHFQLGQNNAFVVSTWNTCCIHIRRDNYKMG